MAYLSLGNIRLWVGLVLAGSVAMFFAVLTFVTAFGILPTSWNRFGAFGIVGSIGVVMAFGAFGVWAFAQAGTVRKANPEAKDWDEVGRTKTKGFGPTPRTAISTVNADQDA